MPQIRRQSTTEDEDNDTDSATHQGLDDNLRLWQKHELVSLQDDGGDAFAYGVIVDGEPDPELFDDNELVDAEFVQARWWVTVKITSVVNYKINLPKDCCFDAKGNVLGPSNLKPKALQEQEGGCIIWHEYVTERKVGPKAHRRCSTPMGNKNKIGNMLPKSKAKRVAR